MQPQAYMTLKKNLFPNHQDETWRRWVDFKRREYRDLVELLTVGPFHDGFKARALFLLLTPSFSWCPIYWKKEPDQYDNYAWLRPKIPENLSTSLVQFAADLVCEAVDHLRHPRKWWSLQSSAAKAEQTVNLLVIYNHVLITLLGFLGDDTARSQTVFQRISLNDIARWWNMDDASGYNPFQELLYNPSIGMGWKRRADRQMREIIESERQGRAKPRAKHEDALCCYVQLLELTCYGVLGDTTLLADQFRFAMVMGAKFGTHCVDTVLSRFVGAHIGFRQQYAAYMLRQLMTDTERHGAHLAGTLELLLANCVQSEGKELEWARHKLIEWHPVVETQKREACQAQAEETALRAEMSA